MKIDVKGLSLLMQEFGTLSNKTGKWTPAENQRAAYLQAAIAAVRAGASLQEVEQENFNERSRAAGLPTKEFNPSSKSPFITREHESEARGWKNLVEYGETAAQGHSEARDMVEGDGKDRFGSYTSLGNFVPTGFYPQLFRALKAHDVLFDEDACTVIKSENGRVITVPVAEDINVVADIIGEGGSQLSTDYHATDHLKLGVYGFKTPRHVESIEAFQDLDGGTLTAINLFREFATDRLARGIGQYLINGTGVNQPLGLIPSLAASGVSPIVAAGSADNTGNSGDIGANSLGSEDFAATFAALDEAYASSPKCAWLMRKSTLAKVSGIVTKLGQPLNLVKYESGVPTIYGIPVKICPSMDPIGASTVPVVLGDLRYWVTRLVIDENIGIAVYTNAPGLAENGNVGLRAFARAGGGLAVTSTNPGSASPFVYIRCHS
jgi:HK97 family phage major capsid protein